MAEENEVDFESRTEPPSPRRRERAQEEGQFAFSAELNSGIVLFIGMGGLLWLAHALGGGLLAQTRLDLAGLPFSELTAADVQQLCAGKFGQALAIAGSLIGVMFAAALAVNVAQVGFNFNFTKLALDWDRVMPYHFDRLYGWDKVMRALLLFCKIAAVGVAAWWVVRQQGHAIVHMSDTSLGAAMASAWGLVVRIALALAGTLLVIGVTDYAYQLWQFERSLYMTKQELKDERKREDGDPQIKARIRKMQREIAKRKMFQQVPKATVVVTNPTHYAVALLYEAGKMSAPKVTAKGADHVARRIAQIARASGVPVLERKSLAQALYKTVKVDQDVPIGLYLVVAELMAFVYRLKNGG
jgi:flagellar biosynthetic protein FlhB